MLNGSSCVAVGIDGSQSATDAALWAIDEAMAREVPIRLVNVIEAAETPVTDPLGQSRQMAAAESAVRDAVAAVEATGQPVTIEAEIMRGRAVQALLEAARFAAMLCVGARGLKHATQGRIGSTAAALSRAAQCPVVIVRMHRAHGDHSRAVVIEVDDTARGSAVLQRGLEAARVRNAPVRVLTPSMHADVQAQWQRRLKEWQHRFADLEITPVSSHGDGLHYVGAHANEIQLVVVDHERRGGVSRLLGVPGNAAFRDSDCSIMVCREHDSL
ncbi:MAG: universal stress protein [Mycolicibacterium sp.]|uniref:universal stress protein n=1 Tax=Mycolicibacterium sp. TaxID=2320850 RepID=UPI003D135FB3